MHGPYNADTERSQAQISEEARSNPNSPYAGKFVGLVNGQVAVVADSFRELGTRLRQMGASPAETLCVEANRDPDEVEEIWTYP